MLGKIMLLVPEVMMENIDAHRGELSRLEFLEYCISTTISEELRREERRGRYPTRGVPREGYQAEPTATVQAAEEYATKRDFEELKQSIRELVALRQPTGEHATKEEFEGLRQSIRELVALRQATEESVTKEEFEEFKQNIKELQKSFIDFFITYGLELGGKIPEEEQEKFKKNAQKLLEL